ncbi:hypothetical protein O181_029247 [Austropuccinia psidii MF-1]|uniref:Uncharacterized protein n=1 Tax=Austropuccinia psidii MF-1 TaxID=1389203 RepID=A0A9Q3CTG0_9BASI|nr:hypothetical protein [Austropuccinia psidii MF-1]
MVGLNQTPQALCAFCFVLLTRRAACLCNLRSTPTRPQPIRSRLLTVASSFLQIFQMVNHRSPGLYAPVISSPLASSPHHQTGLSSPASYISFNDLVQKLPSSPTRRSVVPPISDLLQSDPDDCEMLMECAQDDPLPSSSPKIGLFPSAGSSSPGPAWLPALQADRHQRLQQSNLPSRHLHSSWKQPAPRSSPRSTTSLSSGETPMSSPTPFSRKYALSTQKTPAQLRQQAAERLRSTERANKFKAGRPLLDAFAIGSHRGFDENLTQKEEMMTEMIGRRHLKQMKQRLQESLSSEGYGIDELIENEQNSLMEDNHHFDGDVDPALVYDAFGQDINADLDQDISMTSNTSTIHPEPQPSSSLSLPTICPSCSQPTITFSETDPPDLSCSHCNWFVNAQTLQVVDNYFSQHGDRTSHRPIIGYNNHVGTSFVCSNPECDEMLFV